MGNIISNFRARFFFLKAVPSWKSIGRHARPGLTDRGSIDQEIGKKGKRVGDWIHKQRKGEHHTWVLLIHHPMYFRDRRSSFKRKGIIPCGRVQPTQHGPGVGYLFWNQDRGSKVKLTYKRPRTTRKFFSLLLFQAVSSSVHSDNPAKFLCTF